MDRRILFLLTEHEIREARRNKWFLMSAALFSLLSLSLSFMSYAAMGQLGVSGFGRTAGSLVNLVLLIVPLMGLVLGALSISGDRERGVLKTLLAHPVSLQEIFMGKFLGASLALMLALLTGFGLSGFVIGLHAGTAQLLPYAGLVAGSAFLGWIYLAVGFICSAFIGKHSSAVAWALFLWFVFLIFSDMGLMGALIALKLKPDQLLWLALMNPSQSFKLLNIGLIQGNLDILGAAGRYALDQYGQGFYIILAACLAAWLVIPLGMAWIIFYRKGT